MNEINLKPGQTVSYNNSEYQVIENRILKGKAKNSAMLIMGVVSFLLIPAVMLIYFIVLNVMGVHGQQFEFGMTNALVYMVIIIISFVLFIVAHEYVHYLTYRYIGKTEKDKIKFGLALKTGMAYCIALSPNTIKVSRLSLMMPFYVLVIPFIILAVALQSGLLIFIAALFASGSAGDFWYMWTLRKDSKDKYIIESVPQDSEYDIGYIVLEKLN